MNIIPAAATAWRDERSIEDAIRHHDRASLAAGVALALSFLVSMLKGTKYAQLASFLDANTLSALGMLVAGLVAGFGHWASRGALASAASDVSAPLARSTGDGAAGGLAPSPAPVGGVAADAGKTDPVRRGPPSADGPSGDFMP